MHSRSRHQKISEDLRLYFNKHVHAYVPLIQCIRCSDTYERYAMPRPVIGSIKCLLELDSVRPIPAISLVR